MCHKLDGEDERMFKGGRARLCKQGREFFLLCSLSEERKPDEVYEGMMICTGLGSFEKILYSG